MIWLTWRQHRRQALFAVVALALFAALVIPTGLAMRATFDTLGLPACLRSLGTGEFASGNFSNSCNDAIKQFNNQYRTIGSLAVLFIFVPLLIGLFWGAPLVAREVEHGTHRLAWTQGVSRRHWAMVKFTLIGLASLVVATIFGLAMTWWLAPLSQTGNSRFALLAFDVQGVAPVGYTLFAVALGIFAGTVWPRMLPAMAVTLVGFIGVRIALAGFGRPNYLPPLSHTFPVAGVSPALNSALEEWVMSQDVRNADGTVILSNAQLGCRPGDASCSGLGPGAYNFELYQPGDRFWLFQGIETAILLALVAVLLYLAVRRLRRIA